MHLDENKASIPTGFPQLTQILDGFRPGQLIVVASRVGEGRSALMLNFIDVAVSMGYNVIFFTPEMSIRDHMGRWIAMKSQIPHVHVERGQLDMTPNEQGLTEFDRVQQASEMIKGYPGTLYLNESNRTTIESMRREVLNFLKEKRLDMIIVDTLHWITSKQYQGRDDVYRTLKTLAEEFHVPIIVTTPLKPADDNTPEPQLSEVYDSEDAEELERIADTILLIHKSPEARDIDSEYDANLLISKNGGGQTRSIPLHFVGPYLQFSQRNNE